MSRQKLSKLKEKLETRHTVSIVREGNSYFLRFTTYPGGVLFQVNSTDLFDKDGMRFEDDLT